MIIGTTTNGHDRITGTPDAERLEGGRGNDTLIGGGGADTLVGGNGDDHLITRDGTGTTGLRGGQGDDYLYATLTGRGQVHMFGMDGEDTLVMDLTKNPDRFRNGDGEQIDYMGQHAYGGGGADTFAFVNGEDALGTIIGRIDDFNASEDTLMLDDEVLDLANLPGDVHLFSFKDQQWLQIGENAFFALEGARNGGTERHFLDTENLDAMLLASRDPDARVEFVDQMNEVPAGLIRAGTDFDTIRDIGSSASDEDFVGSAGNDAVYDTRMRSASLAEEITDNRFDGGDGDDLINAGKGHDTLSGGAGSDSLAGGLDNDLLMGGAGRDFLFGGSEHDTVLGGTGGDFLEGGSGNDRLNGAQGNDVMRGQTGRDMLFGGSGHDEMSGGASTDHLNGGGGRDTLWAGTGDDRLNGAGWSDQLYGQRGNDTLTGGHGNDTLFGGRGDDWLRGGKDQDIVWGGTGRDTFAYSDEDLINWDDLAGDPHARARDLDRIEDFEIGADKILLAGFSETSGISDLSATSITLDGQSYGMLSIEETNQRVLVQLEREADLEALMDEENFSFF
jgi:Ca2+-binding RTX toxin-like protein